MGEGKGWVRRELPSQNGGGMRSHTEEESEQKGCPKAQSFATGKTVQAQRHITWGHGENLDTVQWRERKPRCRSVTWTLDAVVIARGSWEQQFFEELQTLTSKSLSVCPGIYILPNSPLNVKHPKV